MAIISKQLSANQVVAGDVLHTDDPFNGVISVGLCSRFQVHCEKALGLVFGSKVDEPNPGVDSCVPWDAGRAAHSPESKLRM